MSYIELFKWVFLWITSMVAAMMLSVVNLRSYYTAADVETRELFNTYLFLSLAVATFIFYVLLSRRGITWDDYLKKLVPVSWVCIWVLLKVVAGTEFPYETALWLVLVSTVGFGIPKWKK